MEDLKDTMDTVSKLSSDRLGILEQALPLAEHFHQSHADLSSWLVDMERQVSMLSMPALRPDLITQQQDRNEVNYFGKKIKSFVCSAFVKIASSDFAVIFVDMSIIIIGRAI